MTSLPKVTLSDGESVPALGQGTWFMGEDASRRSEELNALRTGIDLGMTLIDTAEMYGDGAAERLIAEVIDGRRDEVFLVSKVFPHNATRTGMKRACENSLKRLGVETIDLYLLHWRGAAPLQETIEAFQALQKACKIRYYGVSNFDVTDLEALVTLPGGLAIATNQVLYNLAERGIEWDLLPWCREHQLPLMAYSPLEHPEAGRDVLLANPVINRIATAHQATPAQVALAWLLRQPDMMVIPKAASVTHVHDNHAALELALTAADLQALDEAFPPPRRRQRLAIR